MISKKLREQMEVIIDGCLECKSKPCMKTCIMLNEFGENPKEILKNCIEKNEIPDKMVYSCNMCNRCTVVCPKNFRIQDIFMESRVMKIKENNGKSPIKGHKAIEAHQYLGYSTIFNTVNKAPNGKKTKRIFFPGCSLPSYNSKAVGNILDFLQEKYDGEIGSILKCCGKPTKSLGQIEAFEKRYATVQKAIDDTGAEEIIVACQSCYKIFKEHNPNQKVISLWEILPKLGLPEHAIGIGKDSDVVFGIHDSCATRDNKDIQDGVRWILGQMEYKVEEPENTRGKTRCCGFGGMVVPANPEIAHAVRTKRGIEYKTDHMVSYCAACRESMETIGKDSDVVFGIHDSCATRDNKDIQDGVRWILGQMEYKVEEPENTRGKTNVVVLEGW